MNSIKVFVLDTLLIIVLVQVQDLNILANLVNVEVSVLLIAQIVLDFPFLID
jgi:hypothetical protein